MNQKSKTSYEVITQEDPETGDMYVPLPEPLLKELGWKEGDDITVDLDDQGRIIFRKTTK